MTDSILPLRDALRAKLDELRALREALEDEAPDEGDTAAFEDWLYDCDDLEEQIEDLQDQLAQMTD